MRSNSTQLFVAAILLLFAVTACGGGDDTPGAGSEVNLGDFVPEVQVQVVDHGFRTAGWTDDNLNNDPIFSLIGSATSSLDIAVTRINRQEIVEALLAEARSGTSIRIVTEKAYYDSPAYKAFYDQLEDPAENGGNIVIHTDNEGLPRVMHARFMVIDNARVIMGSYNWETVANEHTFGDVISILHTGVAAAFANQFNQMFIEGNFGVHKRNDTQHPFLLGSGSGSLEVYFGPTDQPRDLLLQEVAFSQNVIFAVQQFKDVTMQDNFLAWVSASPDNNLVGLITEIPGVADADADEIAVYGNFADYIDNPLGGALYLNELIDMSGNFNEFDQMNHKMVFADRSLIGGQPAIICTSGNFTELAFTQNDEVMLIMRGSPMVAKYWSGIGLDRTLPPDTLDEPGDFQEFDQLLAMYPHLASAGADVLRQFQELPCGIVYGTVGNFRPTVTIQNEGDEEPQEIDIDLRFDIRGGLYFGSSIEQVFGLATDEDTIPITTDEDADMFVRNELLNPDHRFMFLVPAGEITIVTTVTDLAGDAHSLFEPDEETISIGPGGVKELKLKINQQTATGESLSGGGGGGGTL